MDRVVRLWRIFPDVVLVIANVLGIGEGLWQAMLNLLILTLSSFERCVRLVIEKREGIARVEGGVRLVKTVIGLMKISSY